MFFVDDLLLRALRISINPFDIIWYMELMREYALKEKYNIKEINNKIKENRLMFEIKQITEEEYKRRHEILLEELQIAKEVIENLSKDVSIHDIT